MAVVAALLCYWQYRREKKEQEELEENNFFESAAPEEGKGNDKKEEVATAANMNMGTRELLMDTLKRWGCQYSVDENDRIVFKYQGENFVAYTSNKSRMIHIWDYLWYEHDLYDIEGLSRLKRAINEANANSSVTTIYHIDETEGKVNVHSHRMFLLIPQIPEIENYLHTMLDEFFHVHQHVISMVEKLKIEEESRA